MNNKVITEFPDAPDIESSTSDYQHRFDGPVGKWMLQQQQLATANAFKKIFSTDEKLNVLDVGGGHGQNVQLIKDLGHDLTIVASHQSCCKLIQNEIDKGNVKFDVSKILHLPYKDNSFDVVICYRVMSHMASWKELMAELSRVSKHLVLIDYPAKESVNIIGELLFGLKKAVEKNTRPYNTYHCRDINKAFSNLQFQLFSNQKMFILPMALHRAVGNLIFSKTVCKIGSLMGLARLFGSPVIAAFVPEDTRVQPDN